MAIDSSIYSAIQAPKQVNPLEQFAQVQQIQTGQNQNRLADLMFGEKQREVTDQTALANAYKAATDPTTGTIDRNKLYGALAQGGQGAKLPTVQKSFADQDKAAADMQKSKIESHLKELDAMGQILSGVKDQASWEAARAQAAQMFGPEKVNATMPAQYDAVLVGQKRDQALSVKDQLEQKWKAMEYTTPKADAVLSAKTSTDNNIRTNSTTQRGQNMTDARAREANGKAPAGYVWGPKGEDGNPTLIAAKGGPADLKMAGALNQDTQALTGSISGFDRLATAANEVLNHPGLKGITGLRGVIPNAPGSDAANAQALLGTLKSQVGFGVLQDMRNNSKTGGALGSVSDAEGKRLEANLAALENSQSLEQFQSNLKKIIDYSAAAKDRVREAYNLKHGQGSANPQRTPTPTAPQAATAPNIDALLDKYK